jgi:hypothetical protein
LDVDDIRFMDSSTCGTGTTLCGTACVNTATNNQNCGTCGTTCPAERTCQSGKCQCPTGYTDCGGQCVDTRIDAQNCGSCGSVCSGMCTNGVCQASACGPNSPKGTSNCQAYAAITLGKYWINNNVWGASGATGSQCIWQTCQSGNTIGWGTSFNWNGSTSQVKSYASAVLGWHWGNKIPAAQTGLPVQLSSGKSVTCGWTYRAPTSGTFDVAYDLFAHTIANPGSSDNPTDEIMVWLDRSGGAAPY